MQPILLKNTLIFTCLLSMHMTTVHADDALDKVSEKEAAEVMTAHGAYQQGQPIGQATDTLLAKQRATVAFKKRSIDGEQAARSYARYLKSFEHPIPLAFEEGIKTQKN